MANFFTLQSFLSYSFENWKLELNRSVNENEMQDRVFPDFCPGWLYVISMDLASQLFQAARFLDKQKTSLRRLDDIFVTGKLAQFFNINSSA